MSHCVNYILRENFEFKVTSRRYGAKGIPGLALRGSDKTVARIRELLAQDVEEGEAEGLVGEPHCEAMLLVDRDSRMVRVFGGELLPHCWGFQEHYVRLLRVAWPGWDADWAEGGSYGILGGLDFAEPLFFGADDPLPLEPLSALPPWSPGAPHYLGHRATIISYPTEEGGWFDAITSAPFESVLASGPSVLNLPMPAPLHPLEEALPNAEGGLILFPEEPKIIWWQAAPDSSWHWHARDRLWAGVPMERTPDRGLAHLRLTGRDDSALASEVRALKTQMLEDCWCEPSDMAPGARVLLARDVQAGGAESLELGGDGATRPLDEGLPELEGLGVFPLRLSGSLVRSPLAQRSALYFERVNALSTADGDPRDPPYLLYQSGGSLGGELELHTPQGSFVARGGELSLLLQPSLVEDFGSEPKENEPGWVVSLRREPGPSGGSGDPNEVSDSPEPRVLLVEYRLDPDRCYWAEVETRHSCLPPEGPTSEPLYVAYSRLRICDRPFEAGEDLGWPTIGTMTDP